MGINFKNTQRPEEERSLCERASRKLQLSQRRFAALIGSTQASVHRWEEQGPPRKTVAALFRLIEADPDLAVRVLGEGRKIEKHYFEVRRWEPRYEDEEEAES